MTLGEKIKACRTNAHLSQEKVAELMGVSRQAVTKWELGQTAPSTENLFKLAELFGTTVDLMLTGDETNEPSIAEQIYRLYKAEEAKKAEERAARRKKNIRLTLATVGAYLLVYLIGHAINADPFESSIYAWLLGTDAKYYLFGWLTHQRLFWVAMVISAVPSLWGKHWFSGITFAGFVLGLLIGEVFGPYPAGAAMGHSHYGWLIWGLFFLASVVAGVVIETLKKRKNTHTP